LSKGNGLKIVTLPDSERASRGPGEETDDSSFEDLAADADKSLALSRTSLLSNTEGRRRWAFLLTLSALLHASLLLPLLLFWASVPADPEQTQKEVPVEIVTEEQVSPPSKSKSGQGKDDKPASAKLAAEKAAKEAKEKEEKAKAQQAEKEKAEKDKAEQQKTAEAAEKKLEAEKKEEQKQEAARKSEEAKAQATKNDAAKNDVAKNEPQKPEPQKTEQPKSDSAKQESEKREPPKQESAKQEPPKQDARPEPQAKKEPEKSEQAKPEPKKAETAKSEPVKSKQAPAQHQAKSARAAETAARNEAAKDEPAKSEGARARAARNESAKTAAARPTPAKQNAAARYAMAPTAQQTPMPPPSQSDLDQALGRPGYGFDPDRFRAVAVPLPSEDGDELMSYKLIVFGLLERSKHYPETALQRGARGRAVVGFSLDDEGRVVNLELLKSSGEADLDVESLALVDRASPFPVPPPGAQRTFAAEIGFGVSSDDPDE